MNQWLTTNTALKVVALILATIAWFFVKNITSERRAIEGVPVEIIAPTSLAVQTISEPTVTVILSGTHGDIWQLSRPDLTALVDLHDITEAGKVRVTLQPGSIRHPPRVQVVQIVPAQLTVRLVAAAATQEKPHE